MSKYQLDKKEQELLASIESDSWKSAKNMRAEINKYAKYAKRSLKKDQRISIRMSKQALIGIKARAADEGIPYQTLISSIVHRYIMGGLAARA